MGSLLDSAQTWSNKEKDSRKTFEDITMDTHEPCEGKHCMRRDGNRKHNIKCKWAEEISNHVLCFPFGEPVCNKQKDTEVWILQTCLWMPALLLFNWMCGLGKETISFDFSYLISKKVRNIPIFLALLGELNKLLHVKCQAYRKYTHTKKISSLPLFVFLLENLTRNTGMQFLRETAYISKAPMMAQPNHQIPPYSI